jgi:hypothetical protein
MELYLHKCMIFFRKRMKIEEGLLLQYLESNMNLLKLFASEKITPLNLENFIRGT